MGLETSFATSHKGGGHARFTATGGACAGAGAGAGAGLPVPVPVPVPDCRCRSVVRPPHHSTLLVHEQLL